MAFLKNTTDLDTIFEPRITTQAVSVQFIDGLDLGAKYEKLASGSNVGTDVGFICGSTDIRNYFAAKGTVSGAIYDRNNTYLKISFGGVYDSGTGWGWGLIAYDVMWGGVSKYSSASYSSADATYYYFTGNDGFTYKAAYAAASSKEYVPPGGPTATTDRLYMFYPVTKYTASPTITQFVANYSIITVGFSPTLYPIFFGGSGSISPSPGAVTSGSTYAVSPSSNQTYTLTVGGTATANVAITVYAVPTISAFSASAAHINSGSSVLLYPTFTSPGGWGEITNGIGTVTTGGAYATGALTATTTYYLYAYNGASVGTYWVAASTTVNVYPIPTAALSAVPTTINSGGTTTLYPVFTGGTGVIDQSVGTVTSGSSYPRTLTGAQTITYTLTVTNANPLSPATASANATVTVTLSCPSDGVCHLDGACCPAPDVPVLMADGTEKPAGELQIGDLVQSWNEKFSRFEIEEVLEASLAINDRSRIFFSNGLSGLFACNHRLLTATGDWKEVQYLAQGEMLHGGVYVLGSGKEGIGDVVKILISNLHTYVTLGVVSHNVKGYD
jgi:hypothetical protein